MKTSCMIIPPQEDRNPEVGDEEAHGHDGVPEDHGAEDEDPEEFGGAVWRCPTTN